MIAEILEFQTLNSKQSQHGQPAKQGTPSLSIRLIIVLHAVMDLKGSRNSCFLTLTERHPGCQRQMKQKIPMLRWATASMH
eukprot:1146993-Pelagomonas_calceolata.AAC.6